MAHVAKVKSAGVAPMVGHYAREAEARGYERENIDPTRTGLNYAAGFGKKSEPSEALARAVRERVAEAVRGHERASGKALRKDANVLMDWVVTRPRDCPEGLTEAFFEAVVSFVQERYGRENVPGGFVHMDETTPHVHIPVVPVRDGKLQASKVVNRADLRTFHADLGRAVDRALGVHVSVELDEGAHLNRVLYHSDSQEQFKAARDAAKAVIASETDAARSDLAELEAQVTKKALEAALASQRASEARDRAAEAMNGENAAIEAAEAARAVQEAAEKAAADAKSELGQVGAGIDEATRRKNELKDEVAILKDQKSGLIEDIDEARERLDFLRGAIGELGQRLQAFVDAAWRALWAAWEDHGPWAEERDVYEMGEAVRATAEDWGIDMER